MKLFLFNILSYSVLIFATRKIEGSIQDQFVINTWSGVFENATYQAHQVLLQGGSALDAIESGCTVCEDEQCDTSVGFGNHPDTEGYTSLDAMIMDGDTMDVGSVGYIRKFRHAISIARYVMQYTTHTLLVGAGAEDFAEMMGFEEQSATTNSTTAEYESWKEANCQPNYYNDIPEALVECGPYPPPSSLPEAKRIEYGSSKKNLKKSLVTKDNHDTIGMIVMDGFGSMACGTTTNGANHKVAGRVGDSPIVGAGCYVNSNVGGAAATGDGDTMMRFLPSFYAVTLMEQGVSPADACNLAIIRIASAYPTFQGGMVCISNNGMHAGSAYQMSFSYSIIFGNMTEVQVVQVAS